MPDSLAERVIKETVRRLGLIVTPAFNTNLGPSRILRSKRSVEQERLPCVVVWDGGETYPAVDRSKLSTVLTVIVEGLVTSGIEDDGQLIEGLKADIKVALAIAPGDHQKFGDATGPIGKAALVSCEMGNKESGLTSDALAITFTVSYAEGNGNPYGQEPATP